MTTQDSVLLRENFPGTISISEPTLHRAFNSDAHRTMATSESRAATTAYDYSRRRPSDTSEATVIEAPMGKLDVASVIFNKMVGTGIFTTPGQVLVSTGSKKASLVLWALGGLWTAAW
jgi:hypothetical protein